MNYKQAFTEVVCSIIPLLYLQYGFFNEGFQRVSSGVDWVDFIYVNRSSTLVLVPWQNVNWISDKLYGGPMTA